MNVFLLIIHSATVLKTSTFLAILEIKSGNKRRNRICKDTSLHTQTLRYLLLASILNDTSSCSKQSFWLNWLLFQSIAVILTAKIINKDCKVLLRHLQNYLNLPSSKKTAQADVL